LHAALESVAASVFTEPVTWEVLVVDNNSSDQTREVVEQFCALYPDRFRYVFEPHPGKSYALNTGVRESRGEILAFMDDDVTVEPTWLQNLTASLDSDQWSGSGGPIRPQPGFRPPSWLSLEQPYALAPLAMFDPGLPAGPLSEPPFGTNMAFRRRVFEKHGYFRTDLGPRPGSEIRNEDTEFGRRLLAEREKLRYAPDAIVYHSVTNSRVQKRYFLRWWFDKARADIREFGIPAGARSFFAGIPVVMFRRLARWTLAWMVTFKSSARFNSKLKVWQVVGSIVECHRISLEVTPKREFSVKP